MSLDLLVSFTTISCGKEGCSAVFAVPVSTYERWRRTQENWWCPNGHCRCYGGETDLQRVERQLAAERAAHESTRKARDRANRRVYAARGQITKIRNRVGNGVCPCCNRFFAKLHMHMATKHPNYKTAKP